MNEDQSTPLPPEEPPAVQETPTSTLPPATEALPAGEAEQVLPAAEASPEGAVEPSTPTEETPSAATESSPSADASAETEAPPAAEAKKPTRSRFERREQAAADALRGLIRDSLAVAFPQVMEQGERFQLSLNFELVAGEPGELRFTPGLRSQIEEQFAQHFSPRNAFVEGAVYDFSAASAEAPGCRPPEADSVFAGFDNLGRPKWSSISQRFLDLQDERVGLLSRDKPTAPLVHQERGKDLRSEQLSSAGKANKSFSLLGQLIAGTWKLPDAFAKVAGEAKLALTIQIVETLDAQGRFALRLNVLAGGLQAQEFSDLLQEPAFRDLSRALDRARNALATLEEKARAAQAQREAQHFQKEMKRVPRILQQLMREIEQPRSKRKPAPRKEGGRREASTRQDPRWQDDVRVATDGDVLWDRERSNWVLLGAEGKAHAFAKDGRYLTSFAADEKRLENRILDLVWQPGHPDAVSFLATLQQA